MIITVDNIFTKQDLENLRASAIGAGFGTWSPATSLAGSGKYEGMSFKGDHAPIHQAITSIMGKAIFPNLSFFRILTEGTEKRYIHSDRNEGDFTSILYLSDHGDDVSGTEFYRHKASGRTDMPSLQEMRESGELDSMSEDMIEGEESKWDRTDFIRGLYGRILIFSAPMFHGRFPLHGIGTSPENARMIHVCHFRT